ncbi:M35 family metallo-endopeptidase [Cupriavidus sp. 30B13]|uniref:M35 family metallo-endopeptidase n=1 Tax=Cupriavidus sp. 30B13 TaxID=3384241 RepID=UPI003B8F1059
MMDMRRALRDGDRTSNNGTLVGTGVMTHHGAQLGVEGDIATCPVCHSSGMVTNDCHPSFSVMGKQVLVEGARVNCLCADKPLVIASQDDFTIEVNRGGLIHSPVAGAVAVPVAASNKLTEGMARETPTDDPALICQNMSNAEFYATMNRLRDKAVRLLGDRLAELERWNTADQDKVKLWFGNAREDTRERLRGGMARMRQIMRGLTDRNYERYTVEGLARVGCVPRAREGEIPSIAAVCKPDETYTIFIGDFFCRMQEENNRYDGVPFDLDSKLTTLIHEVSHFPGAMNAEEPQYSIKKSRERTAKGEFGIDNADSIAAYVANIPNWDGYHPVWRP